MSLKTYRNKRNFSKTTEPPGDAEVPASTELRFVVHKHDATRLHYDLRIEVNGVYKSWAVPKGPSTNASEQRLAVAVEDHPLAYGQFEGTIPSGNYGAGTVMIWDRGTVIERRSKTSEQSSQAFAKGIALGKITFILTGEKLQGEFALVRIKTGTSWLLLKKRDRFANLKDVLAEDRSVATGRSMDEIASGVGTAAPAVWLPKSGLVKDAPKRDAKAKAPTVQPEDLAPQKPRSSKPEHVPHKLKPLNPLQGPERFNHRDWRYTTQSHGFRSFAAMEKGKVTIYSPAGVVYHAEYPSLVPALRAVGGEYLLDGEIVVAGKNGRESRDLLLSKEGSPQFRVNDICHYNGKSTRDWSWIERQKLLREILAKASSLIVVPDIFTTDQAAVDAAQNAGLNEIRAWHRTGKYISGVSNVTVSIPLQSREVPRNATMTHLDRVYWPKEGYTKGDLYEYYKSVASIILPYLKNRPMSLNRHPQGIGVEGFYHKDITGYTPTFLNTHRVESRSQGKTVNYALCQNVESLFYLVNLGCIEMNPWISRVRNLDEPDYCVIDLDPDDTNPFPHVVEIAIAFRKILERMNCKAFLKTSGASGLHIYIPVEPGATFDETRDFAHKICQQVNLLFSDTTSLIRNPAQRRGRVYLDYMQNRRGSTMAAPYCVRPRPLAPVSTPLSWDELTPSLRPTDFTIKNTLARLDRLGDLWAGFGR